MQVSTFGNHWLYCQLGGKKTIMSAVNCENCVDFPAVKPMQSCVVSVSVVRVLYVCGVDDFVFWGEWKRKTIQALLNITFL